MKTWLSCILASIIGFTAAYVLGSMPQFDLIIGYATSIVLNIGTFILLPLVFVTLLSGTGSLRKDRASIGPVYLVSVAWSVFTSLVLSILAGYAFRYFPADFPMSNGAQFTTDSVLAESLKSNMNQMLSTYNPLANSPFMNLIISPGWLLPVAFTAFVFGFAMKPDNDAIKPAYAVMNSFSEIMYRLSRLMSSLCWVFIMVYSAYWFKTLRTSGLIDIPRFLILSGAIVGAAILVIIPLLFWLFTGFKGNPYRFLFRTLSQALLGLFSGNMLLSLTGAYHIGRRSLGVQKRVVSTTMPFSTFFTRGGTAMISTICLCALLTRANIYMPDSRSIIFIACSCTAISMLCSMNLGFESIFVVVLASDVLGYNLGGIEMLMFAILPIINGIGVFVDMILSSMGSYAAGKAIDGVVKVTYRESI